MENFETCGWQSLENGFINYAGEVPHIYEVLHG